jgi:VTC domain
MLAAQIGALPAVSLEEIERRASSQTRVDRKYVMSPAQAAMALRATSDRFVALEIDERRQFGYSSTYFDTADHLSFRLTATARPHRFKVRTRRYLGQGLCMLEVKTRSRRGETIKQRIAHDDDLYDRLTAESSAFIDEVVGFDVARDLHPSVVTEYERSTLADFADGSRVTVDWAFGFAAPGDSARTTSDQIIIETKTLGPINALDRALWNQCVRPVRISKFGVATVMLNPEVPGNRWNRVLREHFDWMPG